MEAEKKELLRLANEKIVKIINEEVLPLFENVNNFYKVEDGLKNHSFAWYPFLCYNGNNGSYFEYDNQIVEDVIKILES